MLDRPRAILALSRACFDDTSRPTRELFTALAKEREVLFVEEPAAAEPGVPDSWEIQFPAPHLLVSRPVLRTPSRGFEKAPLGRVTAMLRQLLRWQDIEDFVAWVDTPHALPIAERLEAQFLVYECPDALGSPRGEEDPHLVRLEAELVRTADLVLVADPGDAALSPSRTALRMLADLAEAERAPRALRRRRSLRGPPARRPRREAAH